MKANEYRILSLLGISFLAFLSRPAMAAELTPPHWYWQTYGWERQQGYQTGYLSITDAAKDVKRWLQQLEHSGCQTRNYWGKSLTYIEVISTKPTAVWPKTFTKGCLSLHRWPDRLWR